MILFSTGSLYSYGTARVFDLAAQVGYDGIEVMVDGRLDTHQPAYLRRLSARTGLPIKVVHSPFTKFVPGWPDDQAPRLRRSLELAQEVGADRVVAHLPHRYHRLSLRWNLGRPRRLQTLIPYPLHSPYERVLQEDLAELEAETGVMVGVENMPASRWMFGAVSRYWFNTLEKLAQFPHLTLDTTHLGTWGMDPLAVYNRLRDRIVHVHLSNFNGEEHRAPDDGELPLDHFLHHLADDGYQGTITIESHPVALRADREESCIRAMADALAFCREHFRVTPTGEIE